MTKGAMEGLQSSEPCQFPVAARRTSQTIDSEHSVLYLNHNNSNIIEPISHGDSVEIILQWRVMEIISAITRGQGRHKNLLLCQTASENSVGDQMLHEIA